MRPRVSVVAGEEELGEQRLCSSCGEWWPNDPDFYYSKAWTTAEGQPRRTVYARCRACWTEQSAAQYAEKAAIRRARWREAHAARIASETPEEREARLARRRKTRRVWLAENGDKLAEYRRRYYETHREEKLAKFNAYRRAKRAQVSAA